MPSASTDSAEGSQRAAGCTLASSLQTRVLIYSGLGWAGDETEGRLGGGRE